MPEPAKHYPWHAKRRLFMEDSEGWLQEVKGSDDLQFLAMNIVNQLFDLAEVPVEKRQEINDEADAFVYRLLVQHNDGSND